MDRFFRDLNRLLQPTPDYDTQYANRLALNAMFRVIADFLGVGAEDEVNEDTPIASQERWYRKDDWGIMDWAEFIGGIISSDAPGLRREAFLKGCVGENDPQPDYADIIKRRIKTSVADMTKLGHVAAAFDNAAFTKSWTLCENFIDNIWNLRNDEHDHDLVDPATNAVFRGRMVVIEYGEDEYPTGAQFPNARAFPSPDAAEFYHRFFQAYYAHVVESYNNFGAEVNQLRSVARSSLPEQRELSSAARRLLSMVKVMVVDEEEAFIDDWFGVFIYICGEVYEHDEGRLRNMMQGLEPLDRRMSAQTRGMFMAMNSSVSPRTSAALFKHISAGREWQPVRRPASAAAAAAAAVAFPSDKIKIANTPKEYMSMCLTADKTADECMHDKCHMCQETFMKNGHLVRPVMFHKTHDSKNNEMWVDPVHPEEQVRWGTQCSGCRQHLGITAAQLNVIASEYANPRIIDGFRATHNAILLQRMTRGHQTRKRTVATRVKRQRNRAAFNAAFPPSKLMSRSRGARSNSKTRSKSISNTRSNRHSANF